MNNANQPASQQTFDIMHLVKINASPARVYQAISTSEGIRNWWTRDAAIDSKVGGKAEFGFYQHQFVIHMNIEELEASSKVIWKTLSAAPGWEGTTVSFHLRPEGKSTVLCFAHRGFLQYDEGYAGATTRWGYYLLSLQRYFETGSGTPNPDDIEFAVPRFGVTLEAK